MRWRELTLAGSLLLATAAPPAAQSPKDYISEAEADRVRDSETPGMRIKLFVGFAADRIQKIQYELSRTGDRPRRNEQMNGLLNSYIGCVDEAADLMDLAVEKQQDIRDGIEDVQKRGTEFLAYLKELAAQGSAATPYIDNLEDAIEATQDAMRTAEEAGAEIAPAPVRRRP
jgi:hypothetical protein